jgi:hypothetical protein
VAVVAAPSPPARTGPRLQADRKREELRTVRRLLNCLIGLGAFALALAPMVAVSPIGHALAAAAGG